MKNRKYNLLPYETIVKATAGEPEAVNTVIQTYIGYIKYLSYFQGSINDDIQDYLKAQLMEALLNSKGGKSRQGREARSLSLTAFSGFATHYRSKRNLGSASINCALR